MNSGSRTYVRENMEIWSLFRNWVQYPMSINVIMFPFCVKSRQILEGFLKEPISPRLKISSYHHYLSPVPIIARPHHDPQPHYPFTTHHLTSSHSITTHLPSLAITLSTHFITSDLKPNLHPLPSLITTCILLQTIILTMFSHFFHSVSNTVSYANKIISF